MSTRGTLAAMLGGDWRRKLAARARAPRTLGADVQRVVAALTRDFVVRYAAYHERRQTPGRVYRIPGRHCRMWLPIATGLSVAERRFGMFEPETFDGLGRIVKAGDTVIEIGACYGEFTAHLSRLAGSGGHVYSFELFPPYFAIAERNVALNQLRNVTLTNSAVGRSGSGPVSVDRGAAHPYGALDQVSQLDYSARTKGERGGEAMTVQVPTVSLREFIETHSLQPALIFMDIEGCELEVLHDLQPLLRQQGKRPAVYFELHQAFYGQDGLDWLRRLFERSGYRCQRISNHWWCQPVTTADPEAMPAFAH